MDMGKKIYELRTQKGLTLEYGRRWKEHRPKMGKRHDREYETGQDLKSIRSTRNVPCLFNGMERARAGRLPKEPVPRRHDTKKYHLCP